jgi:desulfoferrodoxin (superoxide reductase-like protein)
MLCCGYKNQKISKTTDKPKKKKIPMIGYINHGVNSQSVDVSYMVKYLQKEIEGEEVNIMGFSRLWWW